MSQPDGFPAQVGQHLAARRDDLDLTQEELAQRIGISTKAVSSAENGHSKISRGRRSDWERALVLRAGTISRAYRDGSDLEPADDPTPPTQDQQPTDLGDMQRRLETAMRLLSEIQHDIDDMQRRGEQSAG